jgi:hypothetical protein
MNSIAGNFSSKSERVAKSLVFRTSGSRLPKRFRFGPLMIAISWFYVFVKIKPFQLRTVL